MAIVLDAFKTVGKDPVCGGLVEADGVTLPLSWTFQEGLDNNSDLF